MKHGRTWAVAILALFATAAFALAGQVTQTYTSTPNAPILPDNGCVDDTNGTGLGGITDAITIPAGDAGTILDVNIQVEFTHTWRSDLQVAVTDGTSTPILINNHDGSGDNYYATLDSESAGGLCSATANCGTTTNCVAAPGPTCQPNQPLTPFNGLEAANRTFTLRVCDRAAADLGNLVAWHLVVTRDIQTCTINQPAPVSVGSDPGQCGAVVNYPAPTSNGCGTIACTPPSGSFFAVGSTPVTCTDATSGTNVSFNVTVSDTEAPAITCPADIVQDLPPGSTGSDIAFADPVVSDNCPGVNPPSCVPASGDSFPAGDTSVLCDTIDAAGNINSCNFLVSLGTTSVLEVPTVSSLGLLALGLLLAAAGFLVLRRNG